MKRFFCARFWLFSSLFLAVFAVSTSLFGQSVYLLKDLNNGPTGSEPRGYTVGPGGSIYFTGLGPGDVPTFWKTDGTAAGTVAVKTIGGAVGSSPFSWTASDCVFSNGKIMFWQTKTGFTGAELWSSDGTAAGTIKIFELLGSEADRTIYDFRQTSAGVFFANDFDVYRTDGTVAGTQKIYYTPTGINDLTVNNDSLYFLSGAAGSQQLFRADKNFQGLGSLGVLPTTPTNVWVLDSRYGRMFQRSGGGFSTLNFVRAAGMAPIDNFYSIGYFLNGNGSDINLITIGANVYFLGQQTEFGAVGLYRASATAVTLVKDFPTASGYGDLQNFVLEKAGSRLVIFANKGGLQTPSTEIWTSDGTAAGTTILQTFIGFSSQPFGLQVNLASDGVTVLAYVQSVNTNVASEIWKTNGTSAGTAKVGDVPFTSLFTSGFYDFDVVGGLGFFSNYNGNFALSGDPYAIDFSGSVPQPPCSIQAKLATRWCDNGGTTNTATDDTWTAGFLVEGQNTGTAGWMTTSGLTPALTGGYFAPKQVTGLAAGTYSIGVRDVQKTTCLASIPMFSLATGGCSNPATAGDLVLTDLKSTQTQVNLGGTIAGTFDATWNGTGFVGTMHHDAVLSLDAVLSPDDRFLNAGLSTVYLTYLNQHFYNDMPFSATIPTNIQQGNYFLIFVVDGYQLQVETNEGNNYQSFPIIVGQAGMPCNLTGTVTAPLCNNNGTPTNSTDDTWTFSATVNSTGNCGTTGWSGSYFANGSSTPRTGTYGTPINLGPFSIATVSGLTLFFNDNTTNASGSVGSPAPATCSNAGGGGNGDLQLLASTTVPSPFQWANFPVVFTAKNLGTTAISAISVPIVLPASVVLQGGNEFTATAGTFNISSKIWTIPTLAGGAEATLTLNLFNLTATQKIVSGNATSSSPADPNAANNAAQVTINGSVGNPCSPDVTPPTIAGCPANQNLTTTGTTATAAFSNPTATDACSAVTFSSNFQSGAAFPIGTTTVIFTARDAANNSATCSFSITVSQTGGGQPDLNLANLVLTSGATVPIGGVLNFTFDLKNTGAAAASNIVTKFYLSSNNTLNGNSIEAGSITTASLAAGQTISGFAASMTVPANATVGNQFLVLKIDALNQITETNEANNELGTTSFVSVTPGGGGSCINNLLQNGGFENNLNNWDGAAVIAPTASAGAFSAKLCQNQNLRQTLPMTAGKNLTLLFKARGETSQSTVLGYIKYLNSSFTPLFTDFFDLIAIPQSFSQATVSEIAPTGTAFVEVGFLKQTAGCVFVDEVCLSEAGGSNPCSPDMTPPTISSCPANQNLTTTGTTATATFSNPTATDNCSAVTFSSNFASGAAFPIGTTTVIYTARDAANNSSTCAFSITVSQTTGNQPDLSLANLTTTQTSVAVGAVLNFRFDLRNLGTAAATGNFVIKSYLSTDAVFSANDIQNGSVPTGNLAAGQTIPQVQGAMTVPAGTAAGQYFLILRVDADGQVAESNENNNNLASASAISVTGGGADLKITISADKTTVPQGGNVTYTITATNEGTATINSATIITYVCGNGVFTFGQSAGLVYASTPTAPTRGTFNFVSQEWTLTNLAAGQSGTLTLPIFTLTPSEKKVVSRTISQSPVDPDSQPSASAPANCATTQDDEDIWTINAGSPLLAGDERAEKGTSLEIEGLDFLMMPNPTTGETRLFVPLFLDEKVEIEVVDQLGRRAFFQQIEKVETPSVDLDLTAQNAGVFFVKIQPENGRAVVKRLIISKL